MSEQIQPHLVIDGVAIKNPSVLEETSYNLTKSGRNASGLMAMDIIARKITLDVSYTTLSGAELDKITSLIDNGKPFFTVSYIYNGKRKKAVCYAGAIKKRYFRTSYGWYWKDVSFALIEQ